MCEGKQPPTLLGEGGVYACSGGWYEEPLNLLTNSHTPSVMIHSESHSHLSLWWRDTWVHVCICGRMWCVCEISKCGDEMSSVALRSIGTQRERKGKDFLPKPSSTYIGIRG